jgi:predicted PurR-regulated permease PerM
MEPVKTDAVRFRTAFVLLLVLLISGLFLAVTWPFLQTLVVGAMLAGLCQPLYRWLVRLLRGRRSLASVATLLILLAIIIGPVSAVLGLVVAQALTVSERAIPWIQENFGAATTFDFRQWLINHFPLVADFVPSQQEILNNLGAAAKGVGGYLVGWASAFTAGTAGFLLQFAVMLYAMFFFLRDGRAILQRIFYYIPLNHEDEVRMLERFVSVTRATIKGTLLIGLIQGSLAGVGFYFAGIDGAAFWGAVMTILSVVPGIGATLVWLPTVIYLYILGQPLAATLLAIWCAAVVGTVDNVLRPYFVGKDAEMPDLLILIGTLGGLLLFGPIGFIIGPVVCGLFLTALDIYGTAFKNILPPVKSLAADTMVKPQPITRDKTAQHHSSGSSKHRQKKGDETPLA